MKGNLFPAIIEAVGTRSDRTLKITLGCQEMSPQDGGQLLSLVHQLATVYISPSEISSKEISQVDKVEPEFSGKTPSKRMRDVLFVLFSQAPEGFKTFDEFYKNKMEAMIEHFKSKLEPK